MLQINKKGFTLAEIIIAVSILAVILTITSAGFIQFTENKRIMLLQNEINNETNFLFETIIKKIRNGGIDYQSYWRENTRNHSVDTWGNEGVNPIGVSSNNENAGSSSFHFNSVKNCSGALSVNDSSDYTGTGRFILENYLYQFIFPGNQEISSGNGRYVYNSLTNNKVHLNCKNDSFSDDISTAEKNERNIYDDDASYGRGPKAFSGSDASKWVWSWEDEYSNAIVNNNPPLMIISADGKNRTIFKYGNGSLCHNNSGCILQLELQANGFDSEGIANSWECISDYECTSIFTSITDPNIGWKDITPGNLVVNNFNFLVGPEKDASLAFNEPDYVKPSFVTLIIETEASENSMQGIKKKNKTKLELETTIIPRNISTIKTLN